MLLSITALPYSVGMIPSLLYPVAWWVPWCKGWLLHPPVVQVWSWSCVSFYCIDLNILIVSLNVPCLSKLLYLCMCCAFPFPVPLRKMTLAHLRRSNFGVSSFAWVSCATLLCASNNPYAHLSLLVSLHTVIFSVTLEAPQEQFFREGYRRILIFFKRLYFYLREK